jgi:ribose 5-phosphate isomerase
LRESEVIKMPITKPFMASRRFTTTAGAGTGTGATYNILATATTNDAGVAATAFPTAPAYYNLYINALIQTADTSTVTTTAITIPNGDTLDPGTPIVIEFVVN